MKTITTTLLASAAMAIAAPAFAEDKMVSSDAKMEMKSNGGYTKEATAEKVTTDGTQRSEAKVDVTVDSDGDKEKVTTTKEVVDPKGLFNKDTVKTERVEKVEDGKVTVETEKTVNGKVVSEGAKRY
ncbi:MAG: hypothetical protein C0436_04285 [Alphaproteobacteria bacterium]|nr:hypothetical protein [Alphaproteobacteria bacterium]